MQTFLPYNNFVKTAECLDYRRLGKQRVECLQILNAINDPLYGWQNHPAVNMWRGYTAALIAYGVTICGEWISRGYKDTCRQKILKYSDPEAHFSEFPAWFSDPRLMESHRSNLLRKDPEFYSKYNWDVPNDIPYYWPI